MASYGLGGAPRNVVPAITFPGAHPPAQIPRATGGYRQPRGVQTRQLARGAKPRQPKLSQPKPSRPKGPGLDPMTAALIAAAVRMRFGGQEQAVGDQLTQNARFSAGVPSWYQQAQAEIARLQSGQQVQSQQTLQGIQSYNSQPPTGTPDAQQAANARNNLNSQYAAMFGRDAQANSDFMARLQAGQTVAQGNTLAQTAAERQRLLAGLAALKGQEGDFRTTYGAQLQSGQAKAANDAAKIKLAAQALGIKLDTLKNVQEPLAKSLEQNRTAGQKVARSGVRLKKNQAAVTNELAKSKLALKAFEDAHPGLKGRTPKSQFSPTQTRKAAAQFRTFGASLDENATRRDPQGAIEALVKGKKVDPVVASAVVESILNNGSVTRQTATQYYRATGHHLHVSPRAKLPAKNWGQVLNTVLSRLP